MKEKSYLLLVSLFCFILTVNAQKITQITHDEKPAIAISFNSGTEGFDNIQLILDRKGLDKFSTNLRKRLRKFGQWSDIASENSVTNFEKDLTKELEVQYLYFEYENSSYIKKNFSVEPKFIVNDSSDSYLRFEKGFEGTIGTDIVAVSIGSANGSNAIFTLGSAMTQIRKLIEFRFSMQIPKPEIPNWLFELDKAKANLAAAEKEQKLLKKRNKKLFR